MWSKFCGFLLKILGWTVDGGPVEESKAIMLGAPHTSIWDVPICYLYYAQFGKQKPKCLIKKEAFVWPIKGLMYKIGGIPTDRKNATTMVKSVIDQINKSDEFVLALAPEGTRKPIKRWKTGFHTIASKTGIPVYLAYFNWGTKHIGIACKFELSDDARADMEKIQQIYEDMHLQGKYPELYVTH